MVGAGNLGLEADGLVVGCGGGVPRAVRYLVVALSVVGDRFRVGEPRGELLPQLACGIFHGGVSYDHRDGDPGRGSQEAVAWPSICR